MNTSQLLHLCRKRNTKSRTKCTTRSEILPCTNPRKITFTFNYKIHFSNFHSEKCYCSVGWNSLALWRELLCYIYILFENDKKEKSMIYIFDSLTIFQTWHLTFKRQVIETATTQPNRVHQLLLWIFIEVREMTFS